jgi:G patch domain-containing protein 2
MAPQPTEDSSSPADMPQNYNQNDESLLQCDGSIQSDSDDLHSFAFAFKMRQTQGGSGNFESDSLNENFSPAR